MLPKADVGFASDVHASRKPLRNVLFVVVVSWLLAVGVLAVVMSIGARPVEADSRGCNAATGAGPRCAAEGWFRSSGERLYANDNRTDGLGAAVDYHFLSPNGQHGSRGVLFDRHNNNKPTVANFNKPEGWSLSYSVCLMDGTRIIWPTCGPSIADRT
jgi:hypothetical protein